MNLQTLSRIIGLSFRVFLFFQPGTLIGVKAHHRLPSVTALSDYALRGLMVPLLVTCSQCCDL